MSLSTGELQSKSANCRFAAVRVAVSLVFSLLVANSFGQRAYQQQVVVESDLRAAVIVGILRYTRWPNQASASPLNKPTPDVNQDNSALTICSWGDAPSALGLESFEDSITIQNQPLRFLRLRGNESHQQCPVIIWGDGRAELSDLHPQTLVICDNCNAGVVEAVIKLVRSEDRIQFDVDLAMARSAGISFSSNLLDLARHVEGI